MRTQPRTDLSGTIFTAHELFQCINSFRVNTSQKIRALLLNTVTQSYLQDETSFRGMHTCLQDAQRHRYVRKEAYSFLYDTLQ